MSDGIVGSGAVVVGVGAGDLLAETAPNGSANGITGQGRVIVTGDSNAQTCTEFDAFGRTAGPSSDGSVVGTSDAGIAWTSYGPPHFYTAGAPSTGITYEVDGTGLIVTVDVDTEWGGVGVLLPVIALDVAFTVSDYDPNDEICTIIPVNPTGTWNLSLELDGYNLFGPGGGNLALFTSPHPGDFADAPELDGSPARIRLQVDSAGARVWIWRPGDPEPTTWRDNQAIAYGSTVLGRLAFFIEADIKGTNGSFKISDLEVTGVDSCFDGSLCQDYSSTVTNFSGTSHQAGPFVSTGSWGGSALGPTHLWELAGFSQTIPLVFPGDDWDLGGGIHWNALSPEFRAGTGLRPVVHVSTRFNPDIGVGIFSPSTSGERFYNSTFFLQDYEMSVAFDAADYRVFSAGPGNTYSSGMTGAGTLTYYSNPTSGTGDSVDVAGGVGSMTQAPGHDRDWYMVLRYYAGAPWARDVVTEKVRFMMSSTDAGHLIEVVFGAGRVSIDPSVAGFALITEEGSVASSPAVPWIASQWYLAYVGVDLVAGNVSAKVFPESGTDPGWQATAPTALQVGAFQPEVGFHQVNNSATDFWTVTVSRIDILDSATGPDAPLALTTPPLTKFTGTTIYGKVKSWFTPVPEDGRSYAITWGIDNLITTNVGTPSFGASMNWGTFFPDPGPGYLSSIQQATAAIPLPAFVALDPTRYVIAVRGQITAHLDGLTIAQAYRDTGDPLFASGTDSPQELVVAIRACHYGTGDPAFPEYTADGSDVFEASFPNVLPGAPTRWQDFAFRTGIGRDQGQFQWTLHVLGERATIEDQLHAVGPLIAIGLFPPGGGYNINVRDVVYEIVDTVLDLIIPYPCPIGGTGGGGGGGEPTLADVVTGSGAPW